MSDTPPSDATPHNVAELAMLCRRQERELHDYRQKCHNAIRQAAEQSAELEELRAWCEGQRGIEDFYRVREQCWEWEKCAEQAISALDGCTKRLRIALASASGEPCPEFKPQAPSALENIKAVASANSQFDKLKGTK